MKKIIGFIALLTACGSPDHGDLFDYVPEDAGTLAQKLGTKFSPTYTDGVSREGKRGACTVANGGGVSGITYHHCMLPGTTAITYQLTGTDQYESPAVDWNLKSWKYIFRSNAQWRVDAMVDAGGANPWTFTEITVQPATVTITSGTCPGNALTSENIQTFVCTSFPSGSTVTESLPGIYKRWDTGMFITVDIAKIEARAGDPANITCPQCVNKAQNMHQIMEHGLFAAFSQAVGIGTIDRASDHWNDPKVTMTNWLFQGQGIFNAHTHASGDACRSANYSASSPTTFAALSGSCVD